MKTKIKFLQYTLCSLEDMSGVKNLENEANFF